MREMLNSAQIGRKIGLVALIVVLMISAFLMGEMWAGISARVYSRHGGEVRLQILGNDFYHNAQ
ncbi:MAG: hypothetical protein PUK79_13195 [Clostridiales bacterium]|nr:hypothetical protein [Clostridiales bacterium]MDY2834234.1 hypothetical protein [Candidatus Aphodomonas sp.]